MALVLAAATAATLLIQPVCSWDRPGVDRYRGTPAAALAHYRDIGAADRAALARRIAAGIPDDRVAISRTAIAGGYQYESRIADMHFGAGRICRTVTRSKWRAAHREPGAVYCVGEECILVPDVCGNVSRVRRIETSGSSSPGTTGGSGGPGGSGGSPGPAVEFPPMAPTPAPVFAAAPGDGESLPPWAGPGASLPPAPRLDYPGPGREITGLLPPLPLAPVPEPSTWAMLLGGIGIVAFRAWRRPRAGQADSRDG